MAADFAPLLLLLRPVMNEAPGELCYSKLAPFHSMPTTNWQTIW